MIEPLIFLKEYLSKRARGPTEQDYWTRFVTKRSSHEQEYWMRLVPEKRRRAITGVMAMAHPDLVDPPETDYWTRLSSKEAEKITKRNYYQNNLDYWINK